MTQERRERPRYRVESGCIIKAGTETLTGILSEVSASGAFISTHHRLPLGTLVALQHPTGGNIMASVVRITAMGIGIAFDLGEASVTFALRSIAGDMTAALLEDSDILA